MDYTDGEEWRDAENAPVDDEMNGRFIHYMEETTAMWLCSREPRVVDGVTDYEMETFPAPILILNITLRNGETHQVLLQPAAATALNGILADHWGRVWGMLSPVDVELSDEAIDKLMNDVLNNEGDDSDGGS
jgi:hypothetical protein